MYRRKSLADFLGEQVVYRNLTPADPTLPRLESFWQELGLEGPRAPRKTDPAYAAIVYRLLQAAQAQRGQPPLEHLLFVGDTLMNDGTAARNLGAHLPVRCFIGGDKLADAKKVTTEGYLMQANRWQALEDFVAWVQAEGFDLDARTAVLFDLDKTTHGARGRNDHAIDQARINAVRQTVEEVLGETFDEAAFRSTVYDRLNKADYHPFTADNQDYKAYISLMVAGQVYSPDCFWEDLEAGRLTGFKQFVTLCDARQSQMSSGLLAAHREVVGNMAQDDPTPFKSFRFREYYATVDLIDYLPEDSSEADLLAHEIVMTGEVVDLAEELAAQGVLVFGLSDKPDESTLPPPESEAGALPLHQIVMRVVGGLR
jgi:FMN phosphatase YigB (HAD superfamily)